MLVRNPSICFLFSCLIVIDDVKGKGGCFFFSFLFHLVVTHYYLHPIDRAAATALVNRHADGSLPVEDFNLELEDQNGEKVRFGSETDRRYDT